MKKFLVILASVIVAALTLSMTTSCQKDIEKAKSLIGTTWVYVENATSYTLKFTSQTECNIRIKSTDLSDEYYEGIFIISGKNITFTFNSWSSAWKDGVLINDNELTMNGRVFKKEIL